MQKQMLLLLLPLVLWKPQLQIPASRKYVQTPLWMTRRTSQGGLKVDDESQMKDIPQIEA